MVAFMNGEAWRLTLETGIMHYWSRSRRSLWKKGETSGHTQEVKELRVDCDQDCVVAASARSAARRATPGTAAASTGSWTGGAAR